jgi:hypothetical protein
MFKVIILLFSLLVLSECGYWSSNRDGQAVHGGNGNYVIRGKFNGNWIPGKWYSGLGAYISYGGQEYKVREYEVNKILKLIPNELFKLN